MRRTAWRAVVVAMVGALLCVPEASAQDAGSVREARRARREARREALGTQAPGEQGDAVAERQRVETTLRAAFARTVRQRLNLTDQQATRLMDVNRRFSEDRQRIARDEIRIRRELRQSIAGRDSARSPETARLLDALLDVQQQRLDLQQKEQQALSEFLTPEQRVRYMAMLEQLRRRIQQRADSARLAEVPPDA